MEQTPIITTREFLHSFKDVREKLHRREIGMIIIKDRSGAELELTLRETESPILKAREIVRASKFPQIKRPSVDVFSHIHVSS